MSSNAIQEENQLNVQYTTDGAQPSNLSTASNELPRTRQKTTQEGKRTNVPRRLSSISTDPAAKSHLGTGPGGNASRPLVKYENTYKMEPDSDKVFNYLRIKEHATREMLNVLKNERYDASRSSKLCKKLSESINQEVKQLPNPRFKLVTVVFIGEKKGEDLRIASRCLWDTRFDNCITIEYQNDNLYAVANIYGLYYE